MFLFGDKVVYYVIVKRKGKDVSQPADSTEPRSMVNVALASVEPNVVPSGVSSLCSH